MKSAECDIIRALTFGFDGELQLIMARDPDNFSGSQLASRFGYRRIFLSQMHAVGTGFSGKIRMIVHNE